MFWNPQDLFAMMGTEIFKIYAPWAEKLTKTRVLFLMAPTVFIHYIRVLVRCHFLKFMLFMQEKHNSIADLCSATYLLFVFA